MVNLWKSVEWAVGPEDSCELATFKQHNHPKTLNFFSSSSKSH